MAGRSTAREKSSVRLLSGLRRIQNDFGGGVAARKGELLQHLAAARLPGARAVERLHEALCFLRAYPDDAAVLQRVTAMLEAFDRRADLRAHRDQLADTGIAGTAIHYSFYAETARWLSTRFPGALRLDWRDFEKEELLDSRLELFATWSETPGLDEADLELPAWVRRLAGSGTSDADYLIRRCAALGRSDAERELFYDELDLPLQLEPGERTPSRSRALLPGRSVHFQDRPLDRARPDLRKALRHRAIEKTCDAKLGRRIIELAREAMVLRHRDLEAFVQGDPRDVRLFDCGEGLEFGVVGVKPERRLLLEAVYGYLTLKNGVPIGYVLTSALFGSSEVAYNVFDTWRGAEAARVYGHVLAVTKQLYGSDTFTIFPYQLGGEGNTEGLESGAWWFYQKLGFRARDPTVLATMERELARMRRTKGHRTPIATLARIAEHSVYWSSGRTRDDVIGRFPIGNVGLAVTDLLARRFGADRERGLRVCADEAAELCGVRGWRTWDSGERLAWLRWSPLMLVLPGVERWSPSERRALVEVARSKGGRRESDYVRKLDAHRKLRTALRRLANPRSRAIRPSRA